MTMQEWPDDKLDEFFRKASEELNPKFEPDDWNDLKKKLKQVAEQGSQWTRFRTWFVLLGGFLLMGLAVWYYFPKETGHEGKVMLVNSGLPDSASMQTAMTPEPVSDAGSDHGENRMTDRTQRILSGKAARADGDVEMRQTRVGKISEKFAVNEPAEDHMGLEASEISGEQPVTGLTEHSVVAEEPKILSRHSSDAGGVHSEPIRENNVERYGGTTIAPVADPELLPENRNPFYEESAKTIPAAYTDDSADVVVSNETAVVDSTQDGMQDQDKKPKPGARLAIRGGLAPEMNAVTFPDFSWLSLTGNVMIEYRIMPRLFIQTGMVKSSKTYCAFPGDYTWPDRWQQTVLPVSVDGTCQILEVPVNICYTILEREKANWMITAGVSSYRMLNEQYSYNYQRPDPSIRWYKWEGQTGWYWMSHVNVSAGYERKLGNRFSVVAEPYIKVPVRKVGFGKINLYSTGILFSVKYNIR